MLWRNNYSEDILINKSEKIELAGNLTTGVPITTPVFDGASDQKFLKC